MVMSNTERFKRALDTFRDGLRPACEATWAGFYGEGWLAEVNAKLHNPEPTPTTEDIAFLFKGMKATWSETFSHGFTPEVRGWVFELSKSRNTWAHQGSFSTDDTLRALDNMERVLEAFGRADERASIRTLRRELIRQMFEEEARTEKKKVAAKPTEGQPMAGLTPWRNVIAPHADVAAGVFDQAEFAADLYEVAHGTAESEYQDPAAFFARTYLTAGLRDLLVGAARRLAGKGGDPVLELQTNFGGGKTHSMIGLYHLASGVSANSLAGVGELLAEAEIELPEAINRAVLVGQMISPSSPLPVNETTSLNTLWGHLAYQLGGLDAYELVRTDDEAGTNPGASLRTLFERYGPAVVLIDEWVAYARQLRDAGDGPRLAGGDFDTQFTFAQTLTEAAAAVGNVVVLVSIPASDIEVGGERGKVALERLKNVVTRKAAQWQPASPDESFEIVRRRLFDPITDEGAKVRDGVIRAFEDFYRQNPGEFPAGSGEADYRRRMELSYPIHPELFDRLFGEWSTLDKFQRTRGVLRLMALVISELWQRGDQSLLIMPGNLPMDSGRLVSEMKKYLEEAWDPVIKSDIDGENALPLRIDKENKHFGKYSATRRVARTVYMGSAARPDGSRGVDLKSITLGSLQPGEPIGQFADALKRLSGQATHLYVDGAQYWYSLQPNVTRVAADRAASNYTDRDVDDEVRNRLDVAEKQRRDDARRQGSKVEGFAALHIFAEGPGDVPDIDHEGVRLVVLAPAATHAPNDANSPALGLAERILTQRDASTRTNQNLLVFVAANANRLAELRTATRSLLAWRSVVADEEALQLTPHQRKQAESKVVESTAHVDSLVGETFAQILVPSKEPGHSDIDWATIKAATSGDLVSRVTKKLASEERLISTYGGIRVRMDLERFNLWGTNGSITVKDLWSRYASLPYLPRLASPEVLNAAISNGTAELNWEAETFAYADATDGETWFGVRSGEHVTPVPSGHILRPDVVLAMTAAATAASDGAAATSEATSAVGETSSSGGANASGRGTSSGAGNATRFYAHFDLDPVRATREISDILEHVVARLGNAELSLEIRASNPAGYDDATRRTVTENATNLGANGPEFE